MAKGLGQHLPLNWNYEYIGKYLQLEGSSRRWLEPWQLEIRVCHWWAFELEHVFILQPISIYFQALLVMHPKDALGQRPIIERSNQQFRRGKSLSRLALPQKLLSSNNRWCLLYQEKILRVCVTSMHFQHHSAKSQDGHRIPDQHLGILCRIYGEFCQRPPPHIPML